MFSLLAKSCLINSLILTTALAEHDFESFLQRCPPLQVVRRDVAIIGGGSSGTYAAIRLTDAGKSVVVVEAKDRLGGQTETYVDEATGGYHNYGVMVLGVANDSVVANYCRRLGVPLAPVPSGPMNSAYFDFEQGKLLSDYQPANYTQASVRWRDEMAKYPFLDQGGLEALPDPVPEDLLLPMGVFLQKRYIGDPEGLHHEYIQGIGDPLEQTTLYAAKLLNQRALRGFEEGWSMVANWNNHEIYDKAQEVLGDNVLLGSRVIATSRRGDMSRAIVRTPSGLRLIEASKLLIAIPPMLDNLRGFDLSEDERELFGQFRATGYYAAILRNTGLPPGLAARNIGEKTEYNLRTLPGPYAYTPTAIAGLIDAKYGSEEMLPDEVIKGKMIDDLKSLQRAGVIQKDVNVTQTEFVRFAAHNPFTPRVSAESIRNGFYRKLFALQGQRHTYYTGAAWVAQESAALWHFTETTVLPLLLGEKRAD